MFRPPLTKEVREWYRFIAARGGKVGGKSRSKAKRAASARNGKLGGRPRKDKTV